MSYTIKEWLEEERPREKMLAQGCESLTSAELISVIIRSGTPSKSAVDIAREILNLAENSLTNLSRLSFEQLRTVPGVGMAKALGIVAAGELGRRIASENGELLPAICTSAQAASIAIPMLKGLKHEEFWVFFLNSGGRLIAKECFCRGTGSTTLVDTKRVVRRAVERLASSVIAVHNHPSGNPRPGESDLRTTESLREALHYFDINLTDHIIVAGNKYFSFFDKKH